MQGEGDGGCRGTRAKGDRFVALVAKGGSGDDGRIKLDHGESESRGNLRAKEYRESIATVTGAM